MTTESLTTNYFRAHLENMVALALAAQKHGQTVAPSEMVRSIESTLLELIHTGFPLERILEKSDLVLHAEGPAVRDAAPQLTAFNWLSSKTNQSLRKLAGEMFNLQEKDEKRLRKAIDLRLTGMAPGSLYLGFALAPPTQDIIPASDEPVFLQLKEVFRSLPELTDAIDDEEVTPLAAEIVPDAAERDASLTALYNLAPTGKVGIHTLDISSPGRTGGTLSQRERTVLHTALKRPDLISRKRGIFTGEVREIDLDRQRLHLRETNSGRILRCVLPMLDRGQAKAVLGEFARVSGEYEPDRNGVPRLMLVEDLEPILFAEQTKLTGWPDV
ncbi:hypothetical protein CO610_07340 [Lysobacteraceae bacterium NML95-0200]|nr:hypothetical protein CO610_07340 [Xanthomonadaceae bacterium NML95-0200]